MALEQTPGAGLSFGWIDGESGWGGPMNVNMLLLDVLTVPFAVSNTVVTPPTSPVAGDKYVVPAGATGEWFGMTNRIAHWASGQWVFYQPQKGWFVRVWSTRQTLVWDGDSWEVYLDTMTPATEALIQAAAGAGEAAAESADDALAHALAAAASADSASSSSLAANASATAATSSASAASGSATAAATSAAQAASSAASVGTSATTAVNAAAAAVTASNSAAASAATANTAATNASTSATNAAGDAAIAAAAAAFLAGLPDANGALLVGDGVMRVPSVAALRALAPPVRRTMVYLEGYYAQGDGGGGALMWIPASTKSDNGGTVFLPSSAPANGRWERGETSGFIPAGWFGAMGDWNGTTGTDNSALFVAALTCCEANRKPMLVKAGRYSVGATGIGYTASVGDNLTIVFEPGVELVCTYSGASYPAVLQINDIGARLQIAGSKTLVSYANAPSSRGSMHAIYLYGGNKTINDMLVRGLVVTNSPNFGLAVYAGPTGGVSSGNKNVWIDDVVVVGSKGDGIHVENFDSGVRITNWCVDGPGDDSVCVSNYTGSSGAATKSTPTTDVEIANCVPLNTYSAAVRLLGVQRCTIVGVHGTLGNSFGVGGASVISCDDTSGDYSVDNLEITASDIETYGGAGLIYYSDGGKLQDVKIDKAICKGVNNYGVRLLQSSATVGAQISDVDIDVTIQRATNSGVAGDVPVWLDKTRDVTIRLKTVNCPSVLKVNGTDRTTIEMATAKAGGSTGTAFDFTGNTNLTLGRLVLDASCTFTTGVTATGNTNVWHTDLWDLSGATNKLSRSGNAGVRGWCQEVHGVATIGAATAGISPKIAFGESMMTGTAYNVQATLASNEGEGWGVSSLASDGVYLVYSASMTGVKLHFDARTNIGY